jgi:hypothetical protein
MSLLFGGAQPFLSVALVDPAQRGFEVTDESLVRPVDCGRARNQNIIRPRPSITRKDRGGHTPQAPFRAVSRYGVADLPACGEPHAHGCAAARFLRPKRGLQNKARRCRSAAGGSDTQEIGAGLECYKPAAYRIRGRQGNELIKIAGSSGQAFAALCPPRRQHPAAGSGCHACSEPMAALADEIAGLVSALHGTGSE